MDNAILRLLMSDYVIMWQFLCDSQVHLEHQAFLSAMLADSDIAILRLFVSGLVIMTVSSVSIIWFPSLFKTPDIGLCHVSRLW